MPALRATDPTDRARDALDALLLVVPAAAGCRSEGLDEDPGDGQHARRRGTRWTELSAGEGAVGLTDDETTGAHRADAPARQTDAPRRGPRGSPPEG